MTADPIDVLITEQWATLRAWVAQPEVLSQVDQPSVLDGWTVGDLIAHVGRSFTTLAGVEPVEGAVPLSLRQYVSAYPAAAPDIAEGTRALAAEMSDDLLAGIDRLASAGLDKLTQLSGPVVRGPRGFIGRDDFAMTRLLELVVHADDLARSVAIDVPPPLGEKAVAEVSNALSDAYAEATGEHPAHSHGIEWIRLATGRVASEDSALPLL